MAARTYRSNFDQSRFDNAQIGGDYYRELAERELIPRIVERQRQALNVVPDFFQFYQRAYTGRRCSCFSGVETSPAKSCLVCFGTGNTDSFQLYGHRTEVFDVTANSTAVNVVPDYECVTRPISFRLMEGQNRGYVEFVMPVRGGLNVASLASLHAVAGRGSRVRCGVKLFSEVDFTPLSVSAVTDRLQQAQNGGLLIRVVLERDSVSVKSPKFTHVRVRYRLLEDDRVRGDQPRTSNRNASSEFGFFEDIGSRSLYIGDQVRAVTSEDLFRQMNDGRLWKVVNANPNAPAGILTSWDLEIRLVQASEAYSNIP